MLAFVVVWSVLVSDPVAVVQLRYPTARTTITTARGYNVVYTLTADAPPELRRAYKALEVAEREVLITEALQLLRAEIVDNERRLEALRTARLAAYLTDQRASTGPTFFDPAVDAPLESRLKFRLGDGLAADAKVERAQMALDRFVDAHEQLRQTLVAIAHPDRRPAVAAARPDAPAARVAVAKPAAGLAEVERAEAAAGEAEAAAEARERAARAKERAADQAYRDAEDAARPAARAAWVAARDEWAKARREWDDARTAWQDARDRLQTARAAVPRPVPENSAVRSDPRAR